VSLAEDLGFCIPPSAETGPESLRTPHRLQDMGVARSTS
jgi:hypothetical protein